MKLCMLEALAIRGLDHGDYLSSGLVSMMRRLQGSAGRSSHVYLTLKICDALLQLALCRFIQHRVANAAQILARLVAL
jgi:hypothetical protein